MNRNNCTDSIDSVVDCFHLYEKKMYYIAYGILQDTYMAEDAVMDAFEKLLSSGRRIDEPEAKETKFLMIKVIRSAAIDIYRKNQRRYHKEILLQETEEKYPRRPENVMEAAEPEGGGEEIMTLLTGFPETYRRVLQERFCQEKTVKETAKVLGISESAVRKRQERGLAMLRERREKRHE